MKTCTEIIDETIAAYTLNNRGVDKSGNCRYIVPDTGVCCAVGRCCEAPQAEWYGSFAMLRPRQFDNTFTPEQREEQFKPEYRGHSAFFWMDLQGLHDEALNWTSDGLSEEGKQRVDELRKKWGNK